MYTKEEARKNIKKLAESFGEKLEFIKTSGQYKEAQIERDFIQPLFQYLNWNTSNEGIKNPSEREFIVQAQGRKGKEPDYLLRLNNKPRFYIEAKHSKYYLGGKTDDKGKVKERTDYIWQAYSYSYSTQTRPSYEKVDFALLTDFEEFRFFDCTFAVKNPELINNYCVLDWTYKDYIENFDKLWEYFEKENVRKGSLEKLYINEKKIKENRISPDKAFLHDLDDENNGWRIKLAKDIKKFQPDLSAEFITGAVQLILDRLIFIKVLSDRELEEDFIQKIVNKIENVKDKEEGVVYEECQEIFEDLDKTYNGSVFLKRSDLDSVYVSNKVLIEILKDFLPENSRYNFKVIPVEILGTIYEQFLGKIVVTSDKRAKIDYKPEVRKAGGVYYTPNYIVNYIVENTVGEKLKQCKKFEELLEIKICDPACGSGSFLIAAYDYLIKWTIKYYEKKIKNGSNGSELKGLTKEERKLVYLDENNNIRLTSKLKRDILKSCIYGVDIDSQAVEVTKMSLSLKTLEDTTHYEVHNERTLFHATILPSLEGNIKCGNSLVSHKILNQYELFDLSEKDKSKINSFNWKEEFLNIFKISKGFDCIIGNPPYGAEFTTNIKHILAKEYKLSVPATDSFIVFLLKSFELLNESGYQSYIIPSTWLYMPTFKDVRSMLYSKYSIRNILLFRKSVFEKVTVEVSIEIFSKNKMNDNFLFKEIVNIPNQFLGNEYQFIQSDILKDKEYNVLNLINKDSNDLFNKIALNKKLIEVSMVVCGLTPYRLGKGKPKQTKSIVESRAFDATFKKNKTYRQYIMGRDFQRYQWIIDEERWISYGDWLAEPRYTAPFNEPEKIVIRQTADRIIAQIDTNKFLSLKNVHNLKIIDSKITYKYLLGILNSKLITWWYEKLIPERGRVFAEVKVVNLEKLPIKTIDFSDKKEKEIHDKISQYVEKLIKLNERKMTTALEKDKNTLQREINSIDNEIDSLVYKLYDLNEEEIKIIERES